MSDDEFDPERHIDAVAPALSLSITEAQRPGVALFLTIARRMATTVERAPVPEGGFHLAPAFRPGKRGA
jgi:hypothetical protein